MKSYKIVEWSYPSSPNAVRFGMSKTGCHTLHTANVDFVPFDGHKTVSGHATFAEAVREGIANHPELPWHRSMTDGSGWQGKRMPAALAEINAAVCDVDRDGAMGMCSELGID
jgi:hypothetical protein